MIESNCDASNRVQARTASPSCRPPTIPLEFSTEVNEGCPLDCGLCPEHKQHACLAVIEVNTGCNLACLICFADAGPGYNLTLDQVESMLDLFIRTEGDPEVVQFSGGEPTIHPQLFDMIRMAQDKGIRYTMVNTNGRRIARDEAWARQLAELRPVVYLQFDGLEDETYIKLRGEPLLDEKLAALDRLAELDMNVILVATVERGVNEHEVGALIEFGLKHPAVRGLNFQPVTHTGRHAPFDPMDRVTIPEVIGRIEEQTNKQFVKSDFVPVPCCHPGCQSITYAFVDHDEVTPLPRILNVDDYLDYVTNRALLPDLSYDIQRSLEALWSASAVPGTEAATENFGFTCATCNVDLAVSDQALDETHIWDQREGLHGCVHVRREESNEMLRRSPHAGRPHDSLLLVQQHRVPGGGAGGATRRKREGKTRTHRSETRRFESGRGEDRLSPIGIKASSVDIHIHADRRLAFQVLSAFGAGGSSDGATSRILEANPASGEMLFEFHTPVSGAFGRKVVYRTVERVRLSEPGSIEFEGVEGPFSLPQDRFALEVEEGCTRFRYDSVFGIRGWVFG